MVKPISAQLADLSIRATNAEDAVAAAQKEAHDKVVARREQAHAAATAAIQKVDRDIKSAGDDITSHWSALKTKVAADMDAWNAKIAQLKHDRGVRHAGEPCREAGVGGVVRRSTTPSRRSKRQSRLSLMPLSAVSRRNR
jgi:hypothetical protein